MLTRPTDPRRERRLWRVLLRPERAGTRKVNRTLPSRRVIRIFESDGVAGMYPTLREGRVEGPLYELPFHDAESLWRDRFVRCAPACDVIHVKDKELTHAA